MPSKVPTRSDLTGQTSQYGERLTNFPHGGCGPLSAIIAHSLAQIQTSRSLARHGIRAGDEQDFFIAPEVNITMCWIPSGYFLMGSQKEEDGYNALPQHQVVITRGFWLAKTQTTQAQWNAIMESNPSQFKGESLPVERVAWYDICGKEGEQEGFLGKLNRLMPGGGRFHLPTEAQWEYARRAGRTGPVAGDLDEIARPSEKSGSGTQMVGQTTPNPWGLHDMHGNVWEWCADWYAEYDLNTALDPVGPPTGTCRVFRGSGWNDDFSNLRVADRFGAAPECSHYGLGFRIARSFDQ